MAIRGLSLAERTAYILKDDPAHPDNIRDEVAKRVSRAKGKVSDKEREAIEQTVREEAGEPTTFYLGNLTHEDKIYLNDLVGGLEQTREGSMRMLNRNTQRIYDCVKRGIVGWENYFDDQGNVIAFELVPGVTPSGKPRKFVSEDLLSRIRLDHLRELASEILKQNGVTTELEKKLEELLPQPSAQLSRDGLATNVTSDRSESEAAE